MSRLNLLDMGNLGPDDTQPCPILRLAEQEPETFRAVTLTEADIFDLLQDAPTILGWDWGKSDAFGYEP